MASRLVEVPTVRYHKTETNSTNRGSMWQLRNQRSVGILEPRICLPQQILGAEVLWRRMRKAGIRRPEIWLVCQRSVTTAAGCRTGSECPMKSAPILVYIVGGIREILTSVAHPGSEAGGNCRKRTIRRGSEPSFSQQAAPGPLIDEMFAAGL